MSSVNPEWSVEHNQAEDVSTNSTNISCKDRRKSTVDNREDLDDELERLLHPLLIKIIKGFESYRGQKKLS